ncbi:MAG: metallophosphoesterase [Candidatus Kariarchaeaceae archaeon]|jgi:Icc-related predicted phosphoesterase
MAEANKKYCGFMLLSMISDIHADINGMRKDPEFTQKFIKTINNIQPDILLVAGDIAGSLKGIQYFFDAMKVADIKYKLFCPGNHDIWVNQNSFDGSWQKYYKILPELSRVYKWHYLPKNPIIINNVAFVGTMGWYDYSTRNMKFDKIAQIKIYEQKVNPYNGYMWMDREYAKFGNYTDKEVTKQLNNDLIDDLLGLGIRLKIPPEYDFDQDLIPSTENSTIKGNNFHALVVTTHFLPFSKNIHTTGIIEKDFFNAFMGNTALGGILEMIPKDKRILSIFGHSHKPYESKDTGIEVYSAPIGYPQEWEHQDTEEQIRKRIKFIEV